MDDTKNDSESPDLNEKSDNESGEQKKKKLSTSSVTSPGEEVIVDDGTAKSPSASGKENESLESVQKYASRIKSFLGWEPYLEEFEKIVSGLKEDTGEFPEFDEPSVKVVVKDSEDDREESAIASPEGNSIKTEDEANLESQVEDSCSTYGNQSMELNEIDSEILEKSESVPEESNLESSGDEMSELPNSSAITGDVEMKDDTSSKKDNDISGHSDVSFSNDLGNISVNGNDAVRETYENDSNFQEIDANFSEVNDNSEQEVSKKSDCQDVKEDSDVGDVAQHEDNSEKDVKELLDASGSEHLSISQAISSDIGLSEIATNPDSQVEEDSVINVGSDPIISSSDPKSSEIGASPEIDFNSTESIPQTNPEAKLEIIDIPGAKVIDQKESQEFQIIAEGIEVLSKPENKDLLASIEEENKNIRNNNEFQSKNVKDNSDYMSEKIVFKNCDKNPYMKQIRRLSLDIVKYVVESSVQEIIAKKNLVREDTSNGDLAKPFSEENIKSSDHGKGIKNTDDALETDKPLTPELNTDQYLYHTLNKSCEDIESKYKNYSVESLARKESVAYEDSECGIGSFKPRWIQQYARPKMYLTLFSIIGIINGCYYSYIVSIISTLEKRYAFKSKVSGLILLSDEIVPLLFGVLVGYIGTRTHRPRMLAIGMMMTAACSFISGIPYLIYGSAKHLTSFTYANKTGPEFCDSGMMNKECDADLSPPTLSVVIIFIVASFLKGFGTLSYYIIGISYMDDNIKKKNTPLYLELLNEKDATDIDSREDGAGSNCLQKIYRSEVRLVVEDCRSNPNLLVTNLESRGYLAQISANMNETLGRENGAPNSGLILHSEGSILKKESNGLSASNDGNKCVSDCNGLIKTVEMVNVVDCNSTEKADASENIDKQNKVKIVMGNDNYQIVMNSDIHSRINGDQADSDKQNERKNSIVKFTEQNKETEENDFREQNKLVKLEESSCLNNGEPVQSPNEEKKTKSVKKIDNSLKVYIQYDHEQRRQSESKTTASGQTRRASRRLSLFSGDTICGMGIFRPRWLQPFATVKVYVILYSIIGILHGSYYSYLIGTLSTLEKRFAFKSRISGVIMITDEITPLLLGVFMGYYAGMANRPRIISVGMLLSALCCFASSLPYFIYGPVQHLTLANVRNNTVSEFCDSGVSESCSYDDRPPTLSAVLILMLGSFFKGFGNLSYYAIGLAYLDDNSDKKSTPIYLAVSLAMRLLGPLVGFIMSSGFLKIYEDPFEDPGFGQDDPRWIGAWWIGFFLQGVLLVIFTLPIALFPRRLPGRKSMDKTTAPKSKDSWKQIFEGLLSALKRLGKNPVFVLLIIYTNAKIFGQFGHFIMLPKYMENQFRLSASEASLYSGATSIACIMIATVVGGFIIWKLRPGIKPLIGGIIVSDLLMCIGFLALMIPRCQPANMVNFGRNSDGLILENACNQMCDCSTTSFAPFCGPDGKTYFSPCFAGCSNESSTSYTLQKELHNCSCVAHAENQTLSSTISEGLCPDDSCWVNALIFLVILLIILSISNSFTVVHTMVLLRTVHPNDKSIALGTFEALVCLFGFIPFPITIGALVDSACLVWEQSCGETGNCWFYDMDKFAYLLHGVSAGFCFLAVLCMGAMYFQTHRIRDLYADDDDEKTHVANIKLDTVSESVTKL